MSTPSRRSQRERVEESSRRLAEAAIELIAEKGYANTTAQEIGIRAGYSRAMVRERFGSKEALVDAVLRDYETRIDAPQEPGTSGLQRVLAPILALRDFAAEDPRLLRAVLSLNFEALHDHDTLRQRIQSWLTQVEEGIGRAVTDGQADGSISSSGGIDDIGSEMVAMGIGYAYRWILDPSTADFDGVLTRWHDRVAARLSGPA
ncbi:TetR/AcrR family transcriptional regulator [Mycolicibacterium komossense]|uniref:TetR/AcrR family transcriptional regulator n=1 Tax=Mycolicibacterium komossense TaxID=1779 RepID=UPI0021F3C36B|nr:TetR/AcrR family transcriptional regulator [Mycolicibacterium komossense]